MRKGLSLTAIIGIILIIGFVAIGCSKGGGSPSNVVKQLYSAIEKGDTKASSELMTPKAAEIILTFGEKMKGEVVAKGGITGMEEKINGDKATVKTTFKDGSSENFDLVKVDGKWKVDINK